MKFIKEQSETQLNVENMREIIFNS